MDDVLLIEKLIEISKENGSLTKENQLIKENNKILLEKLNTQSELTGLAEILDELLNVDNEVIEKKTKLLNNDRIKESLNKFRNESTRKTIVKRVLKKEPLSEE
jgi:hypothetical protein